MIVRIIPRLRLPAAFAALDYEAPEGTAVGDLVEIPFRTRTILGVVEEVLTHSEHDALRSVMGIVLANWCTADHLAQWKLLAHADEKNLTHVLCTLLPRTYRAGAIPEIAPTPMSLPQEIATQATAIVREVSGVATSAAACDERTALAVAVALRKKITGPLLVLVPRVRDAAITASALATVDPSVMLLTGATPDSARSGIITAWRAGARRTLVGTRSCALLPSAPSPTTLVLHAANDEHQESRRPPFFDARSLVHAPILFLDDLPRLEELGRAQTTIIPPLATPVTIIGSRKKEEREAHPLLSTSLLQGLEETFAAGRGALVLVNHKGFAAGISCAACGYVPRCGTCGGLPQPRADDLVCSTCGAEMWYPTACPACGKSERMRLRGAGIGSVDQALGKLFPNIPRVLIEGTDPIADPQLFLRTDPHIVLATETLFANLLTPRDRPYWGLIADLTPDLTLAKAGLDATLQVARALRRLASLAARCNAQALVQTTLPDLLTELCDTAVWVAKEQRIRAAYGMGNLRKK